jgi:hypothetical protein
MNPLDINLFSMNNLEKNHIINEENKNKNKEK